MFTNGGEVLLYRTTRKATVPPLPTTSKLRLFWNQSPEPIGSDYTFLNLTGSGPIGDNISMNAGPGPAVFHPEDFGAIYNDSDPVVATKNFLSIVSIMDAMSDMGGVIELNADLFVMGTITNPLRVFSNGTPNPIHFIIRGATGVETWCNLSPSPAFIFDSERNTPGYAVQYGSTVHKVGLEKIQVISKGNGVNVYAGGKSIILSEVIIFGCGEDTGQYQALYCQDCDGMIVRQVYCIDNRAVGALFNNCHQVSANIVSRNNTRDGLQIQNSAAWTLWANCESNKGYGIHMDNCKEMSMHVWQESNNGSPYGFQGKITNSTRVSVVGINQQESGVAFDGDTLSLSSTQYLRVPDSNYAPLSISPPWPSEFAAGFFQPYPDPKYKPTVSVSGNQLVIAVPTGSYSEQPVNTTGNWLEVFGYQHYPSLTTSMQAGSSVLVRMQVAMDVVAYNYFLDKLYNKIDAPAFKVVVQTDSGLGFAPVAQNFYWHSMLPGEVELIAPVTANTTATIRVFVYVCPVVLPGVEPPAPHNLYINGCQVYYLPK